MSLTAWWIISIVGAGLIGYGVGRRSSPSGRANAPRSKIVGDPLPLNEIMGVDPAPARCGICGEPAANTTGRPRCARHPLGFGSGW